MRTVAEHLGEEGKMKNRFKYTRIECRTRNLQEILKNGRQITMNTCISIQMYRLDRLVISQTLASSRCPFLFVKVQGYGMFLSQ